MSTFQAPERSLPSFRSKAGIWLFWLGLTVLYLTLIYRQVQRPIWYDELITLFIARAPGISHFFHLLYKWDLTPPALHLLARASIAIFGANRVGVRLPSILAFYLASLLSFIYAKRKLGPSYAAMPVLLLWYSPFFQYATEARPYALVLLSFSTLLLSWDSVINAPEDRRSLGGVAIGSAGLVLSQVFAVLSLLPFLVDTVTWSKPRKSAFRLWAALLLPLIGVACYVPFFGGYESLFFPVRFQASLRKAAALFWHALSGLPILILLAVSLIALLWRVRTTGIKLFAFRRIDVFLFATLLSLPFVLNFVLSLRYGAFWDRYCITTVLGFYIVLAAFLKLSWNSAW